MIKVTRFKGPEIILNADLIEFIEQTPDTVITLTNGQKLLVHEQPEEIVRRVLQYKRAIFQNYR